MTPWRRIRSRRMSTSVEKQARSVLCLPLVKQSKLIGVLYLENNLASHVFTPARISVLELLASQAAISLENARLYNDLQEREARIRRLVNSNIIGIVIWDFQGRIIDANQAFLDMSDIAREDLVSGRLRWTELTPGRMERRRRTGHRRAEGGWNRPSAREGVFSQRRQPRAGSARRDDVRRPPRRGRRLRARSDGAQACRGGGCAKRRRNSHT